MAVLDFEWVPSAERLASRQTLRNLRKHRSLNMAVEKLVVVHKALHEHVMQLRSELAAIEQHEKTARSGMLHSQDQYESCKGQMDSPRSAVSVTVFVWSAEQLQQSEFCRQLLYLSMAQDGPSPCTSWPSFVKTSPDLRAQPDVAVFASRGVLSELYRSLQGIISRVCHPYLEEQEEERVKEQEAAKQEQRRLRRTLSRNSPLPRPQSATPLSAGPSPAPRPTVLTPKGEAPVFNRGRRVSTPLWVRRPGSARSRSQHCCMRRAESHDLM